MVQRRVELIVRLVEAVRAPLTVGARQYHRQLAKFRSADYYRDSRSGISGRWSVETRFRDVRLFSSVYKIIGWVVVALGTLAACGILGLSLTGSTALIGLSDREGSFFGGVGLAVLGVIYFVVILFYTVFLGGSLILLGGMAQVLMAVEENTRGLGLSQRITPPPRATTSPSAPPTPSRPTVIR